MKKILWINYVAENTDFVNQILYVLLQMKILLHTSVSENEKQTKYGYKQGSNV